MTDEEMVRFARLVAKEVKNGNGNGNNLLKYVGLPVAIGWLVGSVWWAATLSSDVKHQAAMIQLYDQKIGMLEARVLVVERSLPKPPPTQGE